MKIRKLRIVSQGFFFLLYLYLYIGYLIPLLYPSIKIISKYFNIMSLNISLNFIVFASGAIFFGSIYIFLINLLMTLIFGRFFCGWVCPAGSFLDIFSFIFIRSNKKLAKRYNFLFNLKYFILAVVIITSFLSVNIFGLLEPYSLLTSTLNIFIRPLLDSSYITEGSIAISFVFILFLGGEYFHKRFYCAFLCPSGALLGLLSTVSFVGKNIKGCSQCKHGDKLECVVACPTVAIREKPSEFFKHDCIRCQKCETVCPEETSRVSSLPLSFKKIKNRYPIDLSKRDFVFKMLPAAFIALPILNGAIRRNKTDKNLIRPPFVDEREYSFSGSCVGCGRCIAVCPTGVLQPLDVDRGLSSIKTPHMNTKIGYCDPNCSLCSDVCPTHAIREFTPENKYSYKMGTAQIYRDACVSWVDDIDCGHCIESCPYDAVVPHESSRYKPNKVLYDACTGCGICQWECVKIVKGEKEGIEVVSFGRGYL